MEEKKYSLKQKIISVVVLAGLIIGLILYAKLSYQEPVAPIQTVPEPEMVSPVVKGKATVQIAEVVEIEKEKEKMSVPEIVQSILEFLQDMTPLMVVVFALTALVKGTGKVKGVYLWGTAMGLAFVIGLMVQMASIGKTALEISEWMVVLLKCIFLGLVPTGVYDGLGYIAKKSVK